MGEVRSVVKWSEGVSNRVKVKVKHTHYRHYMVVGCQPHATAAFTPRDILGTNFHESTPEPWFSRKEICH
jgi:hypothetical protein